MNKDTFIFYRDWYEYIEEDIEPDLRLGVYQAIVRYAFMGEEPQEQDVRRVFGFIRRQLDRDSDKYQRVIEKRRGAGRKGAAKTNEIRWGENQQKSAKSANADICQQESAKSAVNGNDNDNESSLNGTLLLTEGCRSQRDTATKKQKEQKKKKNEQTIVHRARGVFELQYRNIFEQDYYWTAKDAAAMKQLLQKISFSRRNKQLPLDEDSLLGALQVFLDTIGSDWLFENYTVTKINGQYNEVVARAKAQIIKGQYGSNRTDNTAEQRAQEVAGLVEELLAGNG